MKTLIRLLVLSALVVPLSRPAAAQTIGKYVPIAAGSDQDHALTAITGASDPAQKLALIDKFAADFGKGDMAIVANEQYVSYYSAAKNYDKAFEYGDKLFAVDPDSFSNAVNMVRIAQEKGDAEKTVEYGEKAGAILTRFRNQPAPAGTDEKDWNSRKEQVLEAAKDSISYVEQSTYSAAYQTKEPAKRAAFLVRFAQAFPASTYAGPAVVVAAATYQQAQQIPKMLEVANGALARDPGNTGVLVLLADYYGEKGEQLDKAEAYAKKAVTVLDAAKRPAGVTDEEWQQQNGLQKGLALSALGQVNLQRKNEGPAVENFKAAAPLLKGDPFSYSRNQYRLAFAYANLKRPADARAAFTEAAVADTPYRAAAQEKLKTLPPAGRARTAAKKP